MGNPLLPVDDTEGLSETMRALSPAQRKFVDAMFVVSPGFGMVAAAVRLSGCYGKPVNGVATSSAETIARIGQHLVNNPKVRAALAERGQHELRTASPIAVRAILEIASDPSHKDRLKAAMHLTDRFDPVTQKVEVNHEHRHTLSIDEQAIEAIKAARALGASREKLEEMFGADGLRRWEKKMAALEAPNSNVIEADYVEVKPDDEDW